MKFPSTGDPLNNHMTMGKIISQYCTWTPAYLSVLSAMEDTWLDTWLGGYPVEVKYIKLFTSTRDLLNPHDNVGNKKPIL